MENIQKIQLGKNGPLVSKLGLGCMRMSSVWGSPVRDEAESIATINAALDNGINFLNTGDFYAAGHNELLVGKAIKSRRADAFISVKFGAIFDSHSRLIGLDLRPIAIKNFINYSLVRLGVDVIDLYQPCRIDNSVPIEDIVGTISELIGEGKVRYLGVSEITSEQLCKANEVYPVSALEIGYSLADRQIEQELLPTAAALGIGVVAFANTAEGLLTGSMKAPLEAGNHLSHFTRFQGENLIKNLETVEILKKLADERSVTPTQMAIAWVNTQGEHIMPLVSMSSRSRLPENIAAMHLTLSDNELAMLNTAFAPGAILGGTYLQR
ncbi:aldo/keto reductase [Pedobacter aquatilis]|uniref:aldo/keto reductase n=1 Tax=Pedobacter aquatilis TaxID=351343 RepID=UPI00293136BD|nr:aldo/keto reductase [Pedobacter aquatilis]